MNRRLRPAQRVRLDLAHEPSAELAASQTFTYLDRSPKNPWGTSSYLVSSHPASPSEATGTPISIAIRAYRSASRTSVRWSCISQLQPGGLRVLPRVPDELALGRARERSDPQDVRIQGLDETTEAAHLRWEHGHQSPHLATSVLVAQQSRAEGRISPGVHHTSPARAQPRPNNT